MRPMMLFDTDFTDLLPETCDLLKAGGFKVHPAVSQVTLHGSRGLAKDYQFNSDIDLCLQVDSALLPEGQGREQLLREVLETTLSGWKGAVELDLAAVFDTRGCGLPCLNKIVHEEGLCQSDGTNCLGVYKIQGGFEAYVTQGVEIKKMYPCLIIWKRK